MDTTLAVELAALKQRRDFHVCSDDTDPRGWSLVDSNNIVVGSVADLIIDVDALVARYMVCSLQRGRARMVLIPTGFVRLENDQCVAHLDFVTAEALQKLPTFTGLPLDPDVALDIEQALTGTAPISQQAKIVRRGDVTAETAESMPNHP
jgi:hypothetical protein